MSRRSLRRVTQSERSESLVCLFLIQWFTNNTIAQRQSRSCEVYKDSLNNTNAQRQSRSCVVFFLQEHKKSKSYLLCKGDARHRGKVVAAETSKFLAAVTKSCRCRQWRQRKRKEKERRERRQTGKSGIWMNSYHFGANPLPLYTIYMACLSNPKSCGEWSWLMPYDIISLWEWTLPHRYTMPSRLLLRQVLWSMELPHPSPVAGGVATQLMMSCPMVEGVWS